MKKALTIAIPLVTLVLGSVLAYQSISNFGKVSPELEEKKIELNTATNTFVDGCIKTLPQGNSLCDSQLRDVVNQACQTTNDLDACNDGRMEFYYKNVGQTSVQDSTTDAQTSIVSETQPSAKSEQDIRCFYNGATMSWIPTSEDGNIGYEATLVTEVPADDCIRKDQGYIMTGYFWKDLNEIKQTSADVESGKANWLSPRPTEYRLLDGTIIMIGEKKITDLSVSSEVKTDFKCFNGPVSGFFPTDDKGSGYWANIYQELERGQCDKDATGQMYLRPYWLDILRADQDIEIDSYGNENSLYTEYRLMNGTILAFGEKEIETYS